MKSRNICGNLFPKYLSFVIIAICILSFYFVSASQAFVTCSRPPYANRSDWVLPGGGSNYSELNIDPHDSVVLIKEKCDQMRNRNPASWIRGMKVKDFCGQIPVYTAIATFAGQNHTFPRVGLQHAAVLVSCSKSGMKVYDQWPHSGGVKLRLYRYGGGNAVTNGNLFYTIA